MLLTHNPQGNLYIAKVDRLTVNGKRITSAAEQKAIGHELIEAVGRQNHEFWAARSAASVLLFSR